VSEFRYSFPKKLEEGVFEGRFKRFFAEIKTPQGILTAHLPNTGSLKSVNVKGMPCLYSKSDDPARKLAYTLEAIQGPTGAWVGVNTQTPNRVVKQILFDRIDSEWSKFGFIKPEFSISKETRFDFAISDREFLAEKKSKATTVKIVEKQINKPAETQIHLIEVKNVTLMEEKNKRRVAMFPDAVTERGQKHLLELAEMKEKGFTAEIVYFIQRSDVDAFEVAGQIDPIYAEIYHRVTKSDVRVSLAYSDFRPDHLMVKLERL
jgi:sugar fermentation stimulation protein A